MSKFENRIVKNVKSPKNENEFIKSYIEMNPKDAKSNGKDISAVVAKDGTRGHALLKQSINRGKDRNFHRGEDFIPDSKL